MRKESWVVWNLHLSIITPFPCVIKQGEEKHSIYILWTSHGFTDFLSCSRGSNCAIVLYNANNTTALQTGL